MNSRFFGMLALACIGTTLVVGCPDDDGLVDPGAGGASSSSTKAASSTLSSVGVGGEAGAGATGGAGGERPNECEQACDKYGTCAGDADRCTAVGVDCDAMPWHPQANLVCMLECIGQEDSTCSDIGDYFSNTLVGPGSELIQCLATCNSPPSPGTGAFACLDCLTGMNETGTTGYCLADLQCGSDTECNDWVGCVSSCGDPACFRACDQQYPAAAAHYGPFYQCVCNDIPPGETVLLLLGQARCWDVCAGYMDACGA